MSDERATFEQTKARLEDILVQVRKKDTSLEQSLDLLEEGVRLANACNELIDQTSWRKAEAEGDGIEAADVAERESDAPGGAPGDAPADGTTAAQDEGPAAIEHFEDDERS